MRVLTVTAMYPTPERPAFGSFVRTQVESLRAAGLAVDVLVLDGRHRKLIYPRGVLELRRRLAARPADVVHAHYSLVGAVAVTQRRAPVVLTYHGDDLLGTVGPDGHVGRTSRVVASAGRRLGDVVDAVIVQSPQMAARLRRPDVHVIPHEVDLETFRPTPRAQARARLGLDPRRPYVLFAAAPQVHVKNFPLARAAMDRLRETVPEAELLVVHREPQPRLALYMSAADALVFPSWQEGSPNVVKQAMACNLPIVATDVGDVRAVIGGTAGCHVEPSDPLAFAARLAEVIAAGARTEGRAAVAHLASGPVARRVTAVYEAVLARRRPVPAGYRRLGLGAGEP